MFEIVQYLTVSGCVTLYFFFESAKELMSCDVSVMEHILILKRSPVHRLPGRRDLKWRHERGGENKEACCSSLEGVQAALLSCSVGFERSSLSSLFRELRLPVKSC